MTRSVAQTLNASIGGNQQADIDLAESMSNAQQMVVTLSVPYILVTINPAQNLPLE